MNAFYKADFDCATGLPFKRNTPKKKIYRKNKPEPEKVQK